MIFSSCSLSLSLFNLILIFVGLLFLYFSISYWTIIWQWICSTYTNTQQQHTHTQKKKKTNTKTKRHKPVRTIRLVSQSLSILLPYIYDPVIHLPCPCAYSACLFVATLIAITIIIIITEDRFVIYIYFALHRPFSLSPIELIFSLLASSLFLFSTSSFFRGSCVCVRGKNILKNDSSTSA